MRKLIIALVLALFPFALWVSGCRRNDQATAFPKGPEVKNLSRAPQIASHTAAAPDIPAVIDPEILASPDQPTFARIRAVMDREAQLSNQYSTPGLFVLPRQDYPEMAVPPEPVFTSESAPALSSREFWSRPAAPLNQPPAQYQQYHDVSAMIPAGQFSSPEPREPSLPTEGIPGVFMGSDQIDAGPFSLAPPVSERLELSERTAAPTPQFPLLDDLKTDMARAIGRNQDPPVLPPLAWAPAQPEPAARSKTGGFLLNDDIRQALEPLPDISNLAGYKNAGQTPVSKTALPPLLTAEAKAEVSLITSLAEFMPPPASLQKFPAPVSRDLYMTDFWNREPDKPSTSLSLEEPGNIFGQTETSKAVMIREESPQVISAPEAVKAIPPRKVALLPQYASPRNAGIAHIDDAIEPPPLKF